MMAQFLPGAAPHPVIATPKNPRCEAQRTNSYANDTPNTDRQCSHSSRVLIGGRHLCLRHAEIEALKYLMENGK